LLNDSEDMYFPLSILLTFKRWNFRHHKFSRWRARSNISALSPRNLSRRI